MVTYTVCFDFMTDREAKESRSSATLGRSTM
jgi:hypothetical protein